MMSLKYYRGLRHYLRNIFTGAPSRFRDRRRAHLRRGQKGEQLARRLLRTLGLDIIASNYTGPHGEIDIVGRDGLMLCFIEVKAREYRRQSRPADAVTARKKAHIIATARHYLRLLGNPPIAYRFDIVEVIFVATRVVEIRYWPNEFSSSVNN